MAQDGPASSGSAPAAPEPAAKSRVEWVTYGLAALIVLSMIAAVLLALGSIVRQFLVPPNSEVYVLSRGTTDAPDASPPPDASYLHIAVVAIDEGKKLATLRASGHRACAQGCESFTLRIYAVTDAQPERRGLPPSATVSVPANGDIPTTTIELPVEGQPALYPADRYGLVLATAVEPPDRTSEEGSSPTIDPTSVHLALESQLDRHVLLPPEFVHRPLIERLQARLATDGGAHLRFVRPIYLQVLCWLLVALIAAAALLSLLTEPLRRLLVGVGGLVLGVWGVRSILLTGAPPYITAVDLLLSGVILLLLYGIAIRVVLALRRGGVSGLRGLMSDD